MNVPKKLRSLSYFVNQLAIWLGMVTMGFLIWGVVPSSNKMVAICAVFWFGSIIAGVSAGIWEGANR